MNNRLLATIVAFFFMLPPVHAEARRPRIGLVLGGGGALGFAHIGVLEALEENRIPIDFIAGTSMGAIVAGMYASGMSPAEMEEAFVSIDWWDVLHDRSPHQYLDYRQKIQNKRYFGMELGLHGRELVFSPGMAYGQKLNNVLGTFALNSIGIEDFDKLNIPFRAIATDLRSGTSIVLDHGNLATAMRASMAVPGLFTPVQMDGMVLVDGGILNNIPVSVAKGMGADIVIAVDVGASSAQKGMEGEFNSLGEVVGRTYTIMQRPDQEKELEKADVVIAPDLADATSSQFHRAGDIIPKGKHAAEASIEALKAYSVDEATFDAYLLKQRRKRSHGITINAITIENNSTVSEAAIRERIRSENGPLDIGEVYKDLNRIHGMGMFQTVTYELVPAADGHVLNYETEEKFWGPAFLHFGLKAEASTDTSTLWSILLNYTRTQLNPLGGEVRADVEIGGNIQRIDVEWYQPAIPSGRLFLAPSILLSSEDIDFYVDEVAIADIEEEKAYGRLEAGISGFEFGEVRLGVLGGFASAEGNAGPIVLDRDTDSVVAMTATFRFDQLDDPVFPKSGCHLSIDGMFSDQELGSEETFSTLEGKLMIPITMGAHTFTARLTGGSSLGTELPFHGLFHVGGLDGFAGYAPYQLYGNYYGIGSFSHRYEFARLPPTLGNGIYTLLRFDAGNAWFESEDIGWNDLNYGLLAGIEADTLVGKCSLAVGKAESLDPRFYFSIGSTF